MSACLLKMNGYTDVMYLFRYGVESISKRIPAINKEVEKTNETINNLRPIFFLLFRSQENKESAEKIQNVFFLNI